MAERGHSVPPGERVWGWTGLGHVLVCFEKPQISVHEDISAVDTQLCNTTEARAEKAAAQSEPRQLIIVIMWEEQE